MHNIDLPRANLPPSFKSAIAARIARSRNPVARLRAGPALELYYEAGDPHSQLCAASARRWQARLRIPLNIHLVAAPESAAYPEQDRQRSFAALDARRIAPCHGLPAPIDLTPEQRRSLAARLAAAPADAAAFLDAEAQALEDLRAGREPSGPRADPAPREQAGAARRRRLGHYLPGMWQYRGEWFWALDRLDMLKQRLGDALDGPQPLSTLDAQKLDVSGAAGPVEFWFSFRSPYSYLAAVEILRRREAGQWPQLQVRAVLPMVMRGLPVPLAKRLYIVRDVYRCAQAQGIPFERIHDPVGDGVLRLLTVFPHQADTDTQLRYCAIAGQSIWAEGLDTTRDDVLRSIFDRCGLDWSQARARLDQGLDTRAAEAHREALFEAGLWGVPSFRMGQFTTWGQDRLWMLDACLSRAG